MGEKVRLQESLHQPSELAKSIGAIFLPADWRGWSYGHYTQLEMIDELLHPALSAAEQRGRDEQREKDARIAQMMATGEDVTTGRLKAINIAAAIRTLGVTND